jgi:hypothetical protein
MLTRVTRIYICIDSNERSASSNTASKHHERLLGALPQSTDTLRQHVRNDKKLLKEL